MFLDAYSILCSSDISGEELETAKERLNSFVDDFEDHFGTINMVFNVHLFRHIGKSVQMNGPLQTHSAYCMESNIGHIKKTVHGTTDVIKQCAEKYLLEREVSAKLELSERAKNYYAKIKPAMNRCKILRPSSESADELLQGWVHKDEIKYEYESIVIRGDFYSVNNRRLKKNIKTDDSFVVLETGELGIIQAIFTLQNDTMKILLSLDFVACENNVCNTVKFMKKNPNSTHKLIEPVDFGKKSIFIKYDDKFSYSTLPNMCERD